ncbi:LysR family transcriptional regulator [Ancylobacter sp. A5.8]|uniref:LysR family transcriptional regulator n=1 Tax=Ancylobacter gelatini TaxID=2919920 RepID=UPI001F4E36BF|nr:LysR family transcriptional regulator [Ancylobacter gelatini]MCJ8143920.1 LysR family transcriptional regulator [Ancylobacter gelatini]
MNIEALRSFLHVTESGSFSLAALKIGVMQSTVSARIHSLEEELGASLFSRSKSGVVPTAAGREFKAYAEKIVQNWDQARQQVGLPKGYSGIFRLGGPVTLQDDLSIAWVAWMKRHAPHVALQIEAARSEVLTEAILSGTLDAGIMYLPMHRPGLVVDVLLHENLTLIAHAEAAADWRSHYVRVEWGDDFRGGFSEAFPDLPAPVLSVGLGALGLKYVLALKGAAYLPQSLVAGRLAAGELVAVAGAPVFRRPIYIVYPAKPREPETQHLALEGLRSLAAMPGDAPRDQDDA